MKTLTIKITIKKMVSEHCPELKYSINGTVSEQGHYFGFGCSLTQEEFNEQNISRIIQRNCQPIVWGCDKQVKKEKQADRQYQLHKELQTKKKELASIKKNK